MNPFLLIILILYCLTGGSLWAGGCEIGAFAGTNPPTASEVREFETLSGRNVKSIVWYQGWNAGNQPPFPTSQLNMDVRHHDVYDTETILHLTWEPWVSLGDISSGKYDAYLLSYAQAVKAWGDPVRIRLAHEMIQDGIYCHGQPGCPDWYPWQDQPAQYVSAFRHVVNKFKESGAANAAFVWCPNNYPFDFATVSQYYPGQDVVDWLCMDGYNFGNRDGQPGWPDWQWFDDLFFNIYRTFTTHSNFFGEKPIMIGEFGSCEAGPHEQPAQTKAAWITNAFSRIKSSDYSRLAAFYWFQTNKECNWRIDSSPAGLSAFRSAVSDPYFTSHPQRTTFPLFLPILLRLH